MKADVNIRDIDGRTALGILFNNSLLGRYLLSRGADVFIKDDKGQNALEICLEYGETWLLEEFQKLGGEMSILNDSKKMFDYVKILMITGLSSRAVNFIDKGYIFIDPSTASSLMKQAQGNFANMVEPIETFELLTRLGAEVEL
jgi:ankyrin repeat protein